MRWSCRRATGSSARVVRDAALREMPAGRAALGGERVRRVPGFVGEGIARRRWWPLEGRRFCVTDGRSAPLYAERLEPLAARIEVEPGESAKTLAEAERVLRELAEGGMTRHRPRGRARRRRRRRPRPASAPTASSAGWRWCRCRRRWWPRWTPPTAERRASTCPRARTTSAPTTSRPRFRRHGHDRELPPEEVAAGTSRC